MHQTASDLTDEQYWSSGWKRARPGNIAIWKNDPSVRQQMRLIGDIIDQLPQRPGKLNILEVGCANSFWLPYLARRFNANVYGLDYSLLGCLQAKQQLKRQSAAGDVWCQDFFQFSTSCNAYFDLIISFGFIEHFSEPDRVLQQMRQMLRPGGFVFATVPNLLGIYGPLQRTINAAVCDDHILMDAQQLAGYGQLAGFDRVQSGYTGGAVWFGVLNFQTSQQRTRYMMLTFIRRALQGVNMSVGWLLESVALNKNQRFGSPYVYLTAQKQ